MILARAGMSKCADSRIKRTRLKVLNHRAGERGPSRKVLLTAGCRRVRVAVKNLDRDIEPWACSDDMVYIIIVRD